MADDQGGLFARSGKDSVNLFGHKVPIAAIAGAVALIGVIVVLRARRSGSGASVGAVPANAGVNPAIYGAAYSPDYSGALANIQSELTSIQQQGIGSPTSAPASPPAVVAGPNTPLTFRFGPPPASGKFVWELTPGGQQQFQQVYGSLWTSGVQPSSSPLPSGLGAFSWEWAPIQ